jgi:hypothetical protein
MKINAPLFGLAGSITVGILYSSVALLIYLWPKKVMLFIGTAHMIPSLSYISPYIKVTSTAVLMGLGTHMVAGFVLFFLIALIYNLLQRK